MIYKYYAPNDNSFCALKEEYFWCSKRKYLNDPFDTHGEIINRFPKFKDELRRIGLQVDTYPTILDEFGILCFSQGKLNRHLWALYSESYKGWALEFEEDLITNLTQSIGYPVNYKDVLYLNEWPDLDNSDSIISIDGEQNSIREIIDEAKKKDFKKLDLLFEYLLLIKEKYVWQIEEEKRIILARVYADDHQEEVTGYKLNWPSGILKSIIVGHNIDAANLDMIKQIARCKNMPLYMTQTVVSGLGFELTTTNIELN